MLSLPAIRKNLYRHPHCSNTGRTPCRRGIDLSGHHYGTRSARSKTLRRMRRRHPRSRPRYGLWRWMERLTRLGRNARPSKSRYRCPGYQGSQLISLLTIPRQAQRVRTTSWRGASSLAAFDKARVAQECTDPFAGWDGRLDRPRNVTDETLLAEKVTQSVEGLRRVVNNLTAPEGQSR